MSKISLVVYGSLINKVELLNNDIEILNYKPILLNGFKREFSQEPSLRKSTIINRAVLNVKEDDKHFINALLIDIYKDDISILDKREIGYNRLKITSDKIEFKYDLISEIKNRDIFIYTGKEEKYNNDILPNIQYMDICLNGAKNWNESFYEDFIKSTFVKDEVLEHFLKTIYK